jgi:uncharacterized protein
MPINNSDELRQLLRDTKVIAVVGFSDRPNRPSNEIGRLLQQWGYRVYPVNPEIDGEVDGMKILDTLEEVPEHIDLVNVFRRPQFLPGVVKDAIEVGADAVWVQLGLSSDEAAQMAEDAGLKYVEDRCIKIDYARLIR